MSQQQESVTRRSFIEKLLLAFGATSSGAIAGSAYVALSGNRPASRTAEALDDWGVLESQATFVPARTVDTAEISRHATDIPRTADYALYDEGRYQRQISRTGPMTQEVHFFLREVVAEIVPGATMTYWTFDGGVPGPMVRARVGDTLDFFLHNPRESSLPHNVDFHAVNGPGGGAARLATAPGETSELKAKLLNPGIYIYHCAFPDIPMHISHGMYGLIVVEPEGGLPPVDHEFYLMQSEFYTDKGSRAQYTQLKNAGHLTYSADFGRLEQPTFVVFNGRPESLIGERALGVSGARPINVGETVRLFVGNIGPIWFQVFTSSAKSSTACMSRVHSTL